jgi:general secretion pathway protein K
VKTRLHRPKSGIALIIVMIAITVLSIMVAAFAYFMKVETKLAQNTTSEQELYWLGRSGVEYCRWVLSQSCPNEPYEALNQKWAGGPGGLCSTNPDAANIQQTIQLGNGSFTWKMIDLERKANINIAGPDLIGQALTLIGVDASEFDTISGSILDWIDPDDATHIGGAESDYYQGLNPPYFSKNAPIDDLSELLLIKGITPDIFWGGAATDHPQAAFQSKFGSSFNNRNNRFDTDEVVFPVGLTNLFAALSTGRININTASKEVLQLIPFVDETIATEIIRMRAGPDGADGTDDDTPFANPGEGLLAAGFNNETVNQIVRNCDVHSRTFEVSVDAQVAGYHRHFTAILGRGGASDVRILTFNWD